MREGYAEARNSVFPNRRGRDEAQPMMTIRKAGERGHARHGWLESHHTFSFADYYDPAWMGYGCLRVINDDRVQPGMGFGTHPHRDMEIITYILSGSLEHKDSMGNGRTIKTGELQYMSAGTGVRHSEFNPSPSEEVHFLQIWIQPDTTGVKPGYAEKSLASAASGQWHLMTSKTGREDSIAIHQDADLWLARLLPGQTVNHQLAADRQAWLHVAEGAVTVNGTPLVSGDAAAWTGGERLEVQASQNSQILLFDLK